MNDAKKSEIKKTGGFLLSAICLFLVFAFLFNIVSTILVQPHDDRSYSMIRGFYEEEENSLDAVFIGSSTSYTDWNAAIAWENYGITGFSFTSPAQHFAAQEYLCKEARKTQPNAVYVFNLVPICEYFDGDETYGYHALLDYMPLSLNKLKMTKVLCDDAGFDYRESAEYFVPLVRYHSAWNTWDGSNMHKEFDGYKGVPHYVRFLRSRYNVDGEFKEITERAELKGDLEKIKNDVQSLLDYLKEENVNAMFLVTPTVGKDKIIYECINSAADMAREAGFTVVDFQNKKMLESIELDFTKDFYNHNHLNIHGALKMTEYLCEYLTNNYDIKDKREDKSFSAAQGWDDVFTKLKAKMSPYVLPQEYYMNVDYTYSAPSVSVSVSDDKADTYNVSWSHEESAGSYTLYRKDRYTSTWNKVAEFDGSVSTFTDTYKVGNSEEDGPYYTVIASKNEGGKTVWSNYNYKGVYIPADLRTGGQK